MLCPLCGNPLPDNSTTCDRCDWVAATPRTVNETRDRAAAILSIVPGLGHLYKGHLLFGGLIFLVIGPAILALSLFVLPATLGVSLIIPGAFVFAVAVLAYRAPDRHLQVAGEVRAREGEAVHTVPGPGETKTEIAH